MVNDRYNKRNIMCTNTICGKPLWKGGGGMNILLVDDDEYFIQALRKKVRWDILEIDHIYMAYNIRQARELLARLPIQIMVCDIEMPQGSGLELLEWVREKGYDIQTIFLTSYAEFNYAKKAIELQSLNYYLKPVDYRELEQGIREARIRAREQQQMSVYRKESEYWERNRESILQNFFYAVIMGERICTETALENAIQNAGLPYRTNARFLPLCLKLYDDRRYLEKWEKIRLVFALENLAEEVGKGLSIRGIRTVWIGDLTFAVLLELPEEEIPFPAFRSFSENLAEKCRGFFNLNLFLGIGCECTLLGLKKAYEELGRIVSDYVMRESRVVSVVEYENREIPYHLPAIHAWEALLSENRNGEFVEKVREYLEEMSEKRQLNQKVLKLLRIDIMQLIYARLKKTEVRAYKLFINEASEQLYRKSIESVKDMLDYAEYLAQNAASYVELAQESGSVVGKIKEYIDCNYTREISRNDLAEIVYLNPDYISRLFRKETGLSISEYLLKKRIDTAKELLENTKMPVNIISMHAGYNNYTYFTRVFRDYTGCSPNEYRKKYRDENGIS